GRHAAVGPALFLDPAQDLLVVLLGAFAPGFPLAAAVARAAVVEDHHGEALFGERRFAPGDDRGGVGAFAGRAARVLVVARGGQHRRVVAGGRGQVDVRPQHDAVAHRDRDVAHRDA